jgi:hypothetical protein
MTALPTNERSRVARTATALLAGAGIFVFACSESAYRTLGYGITDGGSAPVFGEDPDAGDASTSDELTLYCPSSECPAGWTTCPGSRFRCGVDLRSDAQNCGACGHACPDHGIANESWSCIEGECVMVCASGTSPAYDCDGLPDNGCEVKPDNDNCGGCGIKCTDPDRPCMQDINVKFQCGCPDNGIFCGDWPCRNPETDDDNCGGCGNACDLLGGPDAEPLKPFVYYGCWEGKCGNLKCHGGRGDCDLTIENGCETDLLTDDNCGMCGNACPSGTFCASDFFGKAFCACPGSQSFCGFSLGTMKIGECFDFSSDPGNCGGCALNCGSAPANAASICSYGSCGIVCGRGFSDCNGNRTDGCETETDRDPRNCGGCGISCDEATGQACVGGRCVVAPCDELDGGVIPR